VSWAPRAMLSRPRYGSGQPDSYGEKSLSVWADASSDMAWRASRSWPVDHGSDRVQFVGFEVNSHRSWHAEAARRHTERALLGFVGSMLSHPTLLATACSVGRARAWTAADRPLLAPPLFHTRGLSVAFHGTLAHGAGLTLHCRFDPATIMRDLETDEATFGHRTVERPHMTETVMLAGHCKRHLAGFKAPRSVTFVDALPRNAMGKLLRHAVRDALLGTV